MSQDKPGHERGNSKDLGPKDEQFGGGPRNKEGKGAEPAYDETPKVGYDETPKTGYDETPKTGYDIEVGKDH